MHISTVAVLVSFLSSALAGHIPAPAVVAPAAAVPADKAPAADAPAAVPHAADAPAAVPHAAEAPAAVKSVIVEPAAAKPVEAPAAVKSAAAKPAAVADLKPAAVADVKPAAKPAAAVADLKTSASAVVSSGAVPAVATGVSMPQYARSFTGMTGYPMFAALGDLNGYIRDQWENRDGSAVRGGYTIVRHDGSVIRIEYTSDPISGFRVVVRRSGFPDWYPDSLLLGSPLPGGYLPPFYSDMGYGYGSYYGYDDLDFDLDYGLDYLPTYYDGYDYDLYAPTFLDTYDFDLDFFKKRR